MIFRNQMKSDKTSPKRKREYESENENNEKKFCNWGNYYY